MIALTMPLDAEEDDGDRGDDEDEGARDRDNEADMMSDDDDTGDREVNEVQFLSFDSIVPPDAPRTVCDTRGAWSMFSLPAVAIPPPIPWHAWYHFPRSGGTNGGSAHRLVRVRVQCIHGSRGIPPCCCRARPDSPTSRFLLPSSSPLAGRGNG